jgi:tripartite-type tricarboxylate transporter receptor subunit TctC
VKIVVPFAAGSGSDIDEFAAFIRQQLDSWRTKIAAAGIQPE